MSSLPDPRTAVEYRIPAAELVVGDLVNTQPGAGDDWQQVLGVYPGVESLAGATEEVTELVKSLDGRYVLVQLSDLAPVDAAVYFVDGTALTVGETDSDDQPVLDQISTEDGERLYLYTKHELVHIRATS
ncbi:hypothetical protein [Jatrophihabitans sp. GAS493]|uniref:hypothetical protein n=1 Tax=Jatrophihabitans sp. GAS493 TaxID=1907575 RepID=UPI000BB69C5E|nr:hypothetical protein [Jatrophihabitans sp. GAS493]